MAVLAGVVEVALLPAVHLGDLAEEQEVVLLRVVLAADMALALQQVLQLRENLGDQALLPQAHLLQTLRLLAENILLQTVLADNLTQHQNLLHHP